MLFVNTTELPLIVYVDGDHGAPYQRPRSGIPDIPSWFFTYTDPAETTLIMPGYQLTIPVMNAAVKFTVDGTRHNRTYVLARWLAGWVPASKLGDALRSAGDMVNRLSNTWDGYQACMSGAGWWKQVQCEAAYYSGVAVALTRFGLEIGSAVIGAALQLLDTASWAYNSVGDVRQFLTGERSFALSGKSQDPPKEKPQDMPPVKQPPQDGGGGGGGQNAPPLTGALSFSVTGSCTSAGGTLNGSSGNFTPGGRYNITAWKPDGATYPLGNYDHGTVRSDGTVQWSWPCAGDTAGTYGTELVDVATGRSTGRLSFTIGQAAPPQQPPATKGFTVGDSYFGGTWARTDPNDGTWYSKGNRPANAAYWYPNGLGVAVDCARSAATYSVSFLDGRRETWSWWLHVTDGKWMPAATANELSTDGNPGLATC